jgi:hypothetical protein
MPAAHLYRDMYGLKSDEPPHLLIRLIRKNGKANLHGKPSVWEDAAMYAQRICALPLASPRT